MPKYLWLAPLLLASASANAVLITLDANNYAPGAVVEYDPSLRIDLRTFTNSGPDAIPHLERLSVLAEDNGPLFGANVFGSANNGSAFGNVQAATTCGIDGYEFPSCRPGEFFSVLRASFLYPTNYIELHGLILGGQQDDAGVFSVFDAEGNLQLSCRLPSGDLAGHVKEGDHCDGVVLARSDCAGQIPCDSVYSLQISRVAPDIHTMLFGGMTLNSAPIRVDRITFEQLPISVPEPGSLALLGASMLGVFAVRRKRRADSHKSF